MRHLRRLFEALPFTKLVPDQRLILNGPTTGGARIRAARASDGSFALIYSPRGESFTLNKNVIKAEQLRETWYDPRYGVLLPHKRAGRWRDANISAANKCVRVTTGCWGQPIRMRASACRVMHASGVTDAVTFGMRGLVAASSSFPDCSKRTKSGDKSPHSKFCTETTRQAEPGAPGLAA